MMTATFAEVEVEKRIAAAIETADIPGVAVARAWERSTDALKNLETAAAVVGVTVAVELRRYDTAQIPTANIPFSVTIAARDDADPQGAAFANAAALVLSLLQSWQDDISAAATALSSAAFILCGFRMDGGGAPTLDGGNWSLVISANCRGVVKQPLTERNG